MTATTPIPKTPTAELRIDAYGVPFYPAIFECPEALDRVATQMRDRIIATNQAYLWKRQERIIASQAQRELPPADPVPDIIDLRTKADELNGSGTPITLTALVRLCEALSIPIRRVHSAGAERHYITGAHWLHLINNLTTENK